MTDTSSVPGDARWSVKDRLCVAVPVAMLTTNGWICLLFFLYYQVPWYKQVLAEFGVSPRSVMQPMFDMCELATRYPLAAVALTAAYALATAAIVWWLARRRARIALLVLATLGFLQVLFVVATWLKTHDKKLILRVFCDLD